MKQCQCLISTIENIKNRYKKIVNQANQAYIHGQLEDAAIGYDKAFYQIRMLFRLPEVRLESIHYLTDACNNCIAYCHQQCLPSVYLQLAMQELENFIKTQKHPVEVRAAALTTNVSIANCLVKQLHKENCLGEAVKVIDTLSCIWQQYADELIVTH